jgi:hypothetical protein
MSGELAKKDSGKNGVEKLASEKLVQVQVLCDRGLSDVEIAKSSGLDELLVKDLIEMNGWRENPLVDTSEAHDYAASRRVLLKRWERAVGANARWMAMKGFRMIEDSDTPRDFKDAAQGTKMLVEMAREAEGLNKPKEEKVIGSGISMFFIEAPAGISEKVVKEEAIEIKGVEEI